MVRQKNVATPFGKEIKKRLIDRNMTQRDLAKRLNMSYKYLNYIVCGCKPGDKYIPAICEALEIPLEQYI